MDRSAALKIAAAAAAFCLLFVGLTALGLYLLDRVLSPTVQEDPVSDFSLETRSGKRRKTSETPPLPSVPPPPSGRVAAEIERLRSPQYRERVEAENALVVMGDEAVPQLEQAMRHPDPEVRWRAKEALRRIREGR
ncbi:MAG: HEAT repeat domain-containing protein [Planctomycetota bacterium]|jgi:hypothetical protein